MVLQKGRLQGTHIIILNPIVLLFYLRAEFFHRNKERATSLFMLFRKRGGTLLGPKRVENVTYLFLI
jgi:hypothetical protein